jgi:hypothetical protein
MTFYADKLKESFGEPKINNINNVLFGDEGILLTNQPLSVANNRNKNPLQGISITQDKYDLAKQIGGFFIEYYYSFKNKDNQPEALSGFNGLKSTEEFRQFIQQKTNKTENFSDLFGNAKVDNGKLEGSIGVKFGVRINYIPPTTLFKSKRASKFKDSKSLSLEPATINVGGNSVIYNESRSFFTIASYERDVVDKTFSDVNLSSPTLGENVQCYIDELVKNKEFKFFFNKLLITNKIPALLGMYYYDGFIESVGLSESERGEFIGSKGPWKERILKETKEQLADMFKSNYFSQERRVFKNNFDLFKRSRERSRKNVLPNLRKNLDRTVKRKQLRREISRPYDKFGNEKISPLDGLLGD